jgi:putative molybdopterin biosynthesis protein
VCRKQVLEQASVQALQTILQSPAWLEQLTHVLGYAPHHNGQVLSLRQVLPWWDLKPKKP